MLRTFLLLLTSHVVLGCMNLDSHANFKNHWNSEVGRHTYDKDAYMTRYGKAPLDTTRLPNGNIEEKYAAGIWRWGGPCYVYLEIQPETKRIVGWRYEGSKESCRIPL